MPLGKQIAYSALIGLIWTVVAIATLWLHFHAQAMMLLWLPGAISVAALYLAKRDEQWTLLGGLFLAAVATNVVFYGSFLTAVGFVASHLVEPLLIVTIARSVVGRRSFQSLNLRDMVLLLLAALAGAMGGTLFAQPFRPEPSFVQFVWWSLNSLLGVVAGAPVLIYLAYAFRRLRSENRSILSGIPIWFAISMISMFALTLLVFQKQGVSPISLILVGLVFIAVRYGQIGASLAVCMVGLAATTLSIGGELPAAFSGLTQTEASISIQIYMLLMMATSLPLTAMLLRLDRLSLRMKVRNAKMRESLLMLNMAEEVGRIGRWRYDPRSGEQDWSRQMFLINGMDPSNGSDPGPDVKKYLPDGGEELFSQLAHHSKDRARYSFEYHVRLPRGGDERILRMHATNQYTENGELAFVFGVVMDVTDHHQRQEALDKERTRAMRLAAEAQYLAHTDPLTGLANRRRAITQLEKCIGRADTTNRPLALISFDIDHFKRINDNNGHQVGDDVLVRIAEIARSQARASDLVGRLGGEEFIWILPDAGPTEARTAAERLRHAIETESSKGGLPCVTASIGYAMWRKDDDGNSLLARVDDALYAAKEAGRNKVQKAA